MAFFFSPSLPSGDGNQHRLLTSCMDAQENTQSHKQTSWVHLWLSVNGINDTVGVLSTERQALISLAIIILYLPPSTSHHRFPTGCEVFRDSHYQLLLILRFCSPKLGGWFTWSGMTGNILNKLIFKEAFLKHFSHKFSKSRVAFCTKPSNFLLWEHYFLK